MINKVKTGKPVTLLYKVIIAVFNAVMLSGVFYTSYHLFHKLIFTKNYSDIYIHVKTVIDYNMKGYSLMTVLIKSLYSLTQSKDSIAVMLAVAVVLTVFAVNYLMYVLFKLYGKEKWFSFWRFLPISATTVFISSIYVVKYYEHYYCDFVTSTQPWHNTTYILMRLFAVMAVAMYFLIESTYLKKINFGYAVVFTVSLLFANSVKPNFIISFAPIMLLFMIIDFIKQKGKCLKNSIAFGICVLISLTVLFYQYKILYTADDDSQIIFSLDLLRQFFKTSLLALLCDLAFPLFSTFLLLFKDRSKSEKSILTKVWLMYILSFFTFLVLKETGMRENDGNFAWGMYFFSFLLNIVCLTQWISNYKNSKSEERFVYLIGILAYSASVVSGFSYFVILNTTKTFYVI